MISKKKFIHSLTTMELVDQKKAWLFVFVSQFLLIYYSFLEIGHSLVLFSKYLLYSLQDNWELELGADIGISETKQAGSWCSATNINCLFSLIIEKSLKQSKQLYQLLGYMSSSFSLWKEQVNKAYRCLLKKLVIQRYKINARNGIVVYARNGKVVYLRWAIYLHMYT